MLTLPGSAFAFAMASANVAPLKCGVAITYTGEYITDATASKSFTGS